MHWQGALQKKHKKTWATSMNCANVLQEYVLLVPTITQLFYYYVHVILSI